MDRKHIYRLASLITEDEYEGLEDADEFKQPEVHGYGCGRGCWEYEEFPFNLNGQHWLGNATVDYDAHTQFYKGSRPTRYDPGESDYLEAYVEGHSVEHFEIFDNNGETIVKWNKKAGRKWGHKWNAGRKVEQEIVWPAGFEQGQLTDEQLENVLSQISQQFQQDEDRVIEYIQENYDEGHDYGGSW